MTPHETRVRVRGAFTEPAGAELADLSFSYSADVEDDAGGWQQRTLDTVLGIVQALAPGVPPTQLEQKGKIHVAHPTPDSPVAGYTITSARVTSSPASSGVSKTGGSFLAPSKPVKSGKKTTAALAMSVTFRDFVVFVEFVRQLARALPDVTIESITWRLTAHTARRVRRAARSGAIAEAYERGWDLAASAIAHTGIPNDTPGPLPMPHSHAAAGFTLEPAAVSDTAEAAAPSLAVTSPLLRFKSRGTNELPLEKGAFEPPMIAFTAQVDVEYLVRTA